MSRPADARRSWAHVPSSSAPAPASRWAPIVASIAISTVGPAAASLSQDAPAGAAAVLVGAVLVSLLASRPWWLRGATSIATGAAVVALTEPVVGAWALLVMVLGPWVALGAPPAPRFPRPGPGATAPAVVLSVVSAVSASRAHAWLLPAIPVALSCAIPLLSRIGGGSLHRLAERFGRVAGDAVAAVLFGLMGLAAVLIPWSVQRTLRLDPLRGRSGWARRDRLGARPTGLWAPEAAAVRPSRRERMLSTGLVVLLVGVGLALSPSGQRTIQDLRNRAEAAPSGFRIATISVGDSPIEIDDEIPEGVEEWWPAPEDVPPAHRDSEFWNDPAYRDGQGYLFEPRIAWRPVTPYRLLDAETRYVNIRDGRRVSWQPPPCDCRRLTVWVYGGSTTWGLDQTDDHTIPSELARVAWEQGITVDVQNRGQLGHLHWLEAERFAWEVQREEHPDLVVFYDGVNETWETTALSGYGGGDMLPMLDPTVIDLWNSTGRSEGPSPPGPPGSRLRGPEHGDRIYSKRDSAAATIARYERARAMSRATAEAHEIPVRYFWQPSRYSRGFQEGEPHGTTEQEIDGRQREEAVQDILPDDVVDLMDVLDDVPGPLFTDDVHHNELGARVIAEAIFEHIEEDLRRLAARR